MPTPHIHTKEEWNREDTTLRDLKEEFMLQNCFAGEKLDFLTGKEIKIIVDFCISKLTEDRKQLVERVMSEVRIGNLDLSDPRSWEKGYNDCLVKVLALLTPKVEVTEK